MNIYQLRKNFTAIYREEAKSVVGKIAFKTRETGWLYTPSPVIALVSLHSAFHEGVNGDLKMSALIAILQSQVRGGVDVLLANTAHYRAQNPLNPAQAYEACIKEGEELAYRYRAYFQGCQLLYWHSAIGKDAYFAVSLERVERLFQEDPCFRNRLLLDAEATYTERRSRLFPDRELFMERAAADILEQCAAAVVLAMRGYRYLFYPGAPYASTEYVSRLLVPEERRLDWIEVFLSIEKKTVTHSNLRGRV